MPIDIQTLPSDSINTKWKEPYASASLNRRPVGITPPGIYRGLGLAVDPLSGDRTILIQADATKGDHVAVSENEDGYSINYRDGSSGDITISLNAYVSVDVVITIFIDYQVGVSTFGSFRTYTESEYNALTTGERDALVVLGTVTVPGGAGPISAGNISLNRRTLASTNLQKGAVLNAPIVRNSGFEIGDTGESYSRSSAFWEKTSTLGTGTWLISTAQAKTGLKSIQLNITSGPFSGELIQHLGIETVSGELFLVELSVYQLKTVSSGDFEFFIEWTDSSGALLSTSVLDIDGGVDTSWRDLTPIFSAPVGATAVRATGIRCTSLDPSSTGVFAYIDELKVLIEPNDPQAPYPFDEAFGRESVVSSLLLVDKDGDFSDKPPLVTYDPSTPSGEGRVVLGSGDQSAAPPTMDILGRFSSIGSALVSTLSNALKARIVTPTATAAVSDFSLLWEAQETAGSAAMRIYSTEAGSLIATSNARWDGSVWIKDAPGTTAARISLDGAGAILDVRFQQAAVNSWADAAWTTTPLAIDGPPGAQVTIDEALIANAQVTANAGVEVNNSDVVVNTGNVIVNSGEVQVDGPVYPLNPGNHDLGKSINRWDAVFAESVSLSKTGGLSSAMVNISPPGSGNGPAHSVVQISRFSGTPTVSSLGTNPYHFVDGLGLTGVGQGATGSVNWAKGTVFNGWTTITNGGGTVVHAGNGTNYLPRATLAGNGAGGYARFYGSFPYFTPSLNFGFRALVDIDSSVAGSEYAIGLNNTFTGTGLDLAYGFQIDAGVQGNSNLWVKFNGAHVADTTWGMSLLEKVPRLFLYYGIYDAATSTPTVVYGVGFDNPEVQLSEYHAGSAASAIGHRGMLGVENDGEMHIYQFDWWQGLG